MNAQTPLRKVMTASDTLRLIDEEIARFEPRVARALRDGFENIRNRVSANTIADLLSKGDRQAVIYAYADNIPTDALREFELVIGRATIRGAKIAAEAQGPIVGVRDDFEIRVGETNPRLANFADGLTSTRIREIDNGTRDLIRTIIREDSVEGKDPFAIARRIRTSIGLTARQEAAVNRYRQNLEQLDPYALERKLRDQRSDGSVRRAIENEKPLSRAQIESLVDRYRRRWIQYRSQVIARTETIRAVQGAQWELWKGLVDEGKIDARQILRTWHTTPDARLRDEHAAIPRMNPEDGVGLNEPFQSPLGPIMYPGDPSAPAANVIQCRCAVLTEVVSAELLGLRPIGQGQGTGSRPPSGVQTAPPAVPDAGRRAATTGEPVNPNRPPPFKNIIQAEVWAEDRGLTVDANLKGLNKDNVRELLTAASDVYDRFPIAPLAALGPIGRFRTGYSTPKNANAAFGAAVNGRDGSKGIFHAPVKFGRDYERQLVNKALIAKLNSAAAYRKERDTIQLTLEEQGKLDDRIPERIRQMDEDGKLWVWTQTDPEDTPEEQMQRTTYHEFGHALHLVKGTEISAAIDNFLATARPRASGWHLLVSKYGGSNDKEYIAETFAIYMHRPSSEHYRIHPDLLAIYRRFDKAWRDE